MTPPRKSESGEGNSLRGNTFTSTATELAELRVIVQNGEKEISDLKDSHDALKKSFEAHQVTLAHTLGKLEGGMRMLVVIGSVATAIITIGLAIIGLVLNASHQQPVSHP